MPSPRRRCCSCNGGHAVCKRSVCVRSGTPCVSCLPSRIGKCSNVSAQSIPSTASGSQEPIDKPQYMCTTKLAPAQGSPTLQQYSLEPFIRPGSKIFKRIPRASKELAAKKFASLLDAVVSNNSPASCSRLLYSSQCCLQTPIRQIGRVSLASIVNSPGADTAI